MDDFTDIARLPVNSEQHRFQSWEVKYTKSHILSSQCTKNGSCNPGMNGDDELCLFCMYTHKLDLPHLPDMVFPKNILKLTHDSGCYIEFNALDSLSKVSNGKMVVKIACSDSWKESRSEAGHTESIVKPFDWTFSTDYQGTLFGSWTVESTNLKIDINKLKQKEKILFYNDLTLFEDELHDNGTALLSVKIRVMPTSFFILLRYFLRVDNVLIKINDTRFYHEFENNYIIREYTAREAKIDELKIQYMGNEHIQEDLKRNYRGVLKCCTTTAEAKTGFTKKFLLNYEQKVPPVFLLDPNEICRHLPLVKELNQKLIFPKVEFDDGAESSGKT